MIKNLSQANHFDWYLMRSMAMITRILKSQNSTSIILIIFLQLINFFSMASTMFIFQPLQPYQANYIFNIFVIQNLCSILNINQEIVLIILLVILTTTTLLIIINYIKQTNNYIIGTLGHLIRLFQIITIPIVHYCIHNIAQLNKGINSLTISILQISFICEAWFVLLFVVLFTFFQIRPLRYNNLLWCYDNNQNFYRHIFNITRTIVLYFDGPSIILLTVSLVIEIVIIQIPQPYLIAKVNVFLKCSNYLFVITHITIILKLSLNNGEFSLIFMCISFIICLINYILEYWSISQQDEQIPICIDGNAKNLYNFYIDVKTKNKVTKDDNIKIGSHSLICNQKYCILMQICNSCCNKILAVQLQQKITEFLKRLRYNSSELQLMYQLWKIQLSKTITLSNQLRKLSVTHRFIVQHVLGPQNSEISEINTEKSQIGWINDSLNIKWKFYNQISLSLNQFQKLGEIMIKSLPQLNQIINIVIDIYYESQSLKKLFEEMVKHKQINYVCVELYLKFVECFLDENKLSTQILDRLKKLKMLADSDSLQFNPLPCFLIQSNNKTIQKVNAQALKFLRLQKYQVKDKDFNSLVIPNHSLKQLQNYQQQNNKQQYLPIFFKIKTSNNYTNVCRNIKIRTLQINNHSYYQITVHKRNYNNSVIQLLIDNKQNILASTVEIFPIDCQQKKQQQYKIHNIYQLFIKPLLKQINLNKIGRIQFGKNFYVNGLLAQKYCPYPAMRILTLNLIRKLHSRQNKRVTAMRLSKLYFKKPQFNFSYYENSDQSLVLEGIQNRKINKAHIFNNRMGKYHEKITNIVAESQIQNNINYGQGIKVYRLYKNELYNIDLQDKQKYQQQFDGLQVSSSSQSKKIKLNQNYIIICLLIIALGIVGWNIFVQVQINNYFNDILSQQIDILQILQFNLNFNRILSSLRDVANGLFQQFNISYVQVILDSYNQLQNMDESQFFSNNKYKALFASQQYTGTLNQLIEVCLTHIFQFTQTSNMTIIPLIQDLIILQLGGMITEQINYKQQMMMVSCSVVQKYNLISLIIVSILSVIFLILYVLLSHKYKKNMNSLLESLLITSQNQIRIISQECQKFKNIISSLYKNYQVDLQTLGTKLQQSKKRMRPKRINFGLFTIATQLVLCVFFVSALIILTYIYYSTSKNQLIEINKQFSEGFAIMTSYTSMSWLSNEIDYTGNIDQDLVTQLQKKLTLIQDNKNTLLFSDAFNKDIITIFFGSSCQYLQDKMIMNYSQCNMSLDGFRITDPFVINLDLYFRWVQYNLVANITDTFASTGLYSNAFKTTFKYFSQQIQKQINLLLSQTKHTLLTFSILATGMGFCLIFIIGGSYLYYKHKMKAINYGLAALKNKQQNNILNKFDNQKKKQLLQKQQQQDMQDQQSGYWMLVSQEQDQIRQQQQQ